MKRLILSLGIGWALIYTINHILLPSLPSNTKTEVATAPEPSTERRIDSWGAYLPHSGSFPDQDRPTPTSRLSQSQDVAALQGDAERKSDDETSSTNTAKTTQQLRTGPTLGRVDSQPAIKQPGVPLRKAKKSRVPPAKKGQLAQATADQNPGWRMGSERTHGVGLFMFAPPGF